MQTSTRSAAILTLVQPKSQAARENAILLDESGRIAAVSVGAARLLGRPIVELQGSPFGIFLHFLEQTELEVFNNGTGEALVARAAAYSGKPGWTEITFEATPDVLPLATVVHRALQCVNDSMPEDQSLRVSVPRLPGAQVKAKVQSLVEECLASLVAVAGRSEACLAVYGTELPEGLELVLWLTFNADSTGPFSGEAFRPAAYTARAESLGVGVQTEYDYPVVHIRLLVPQAS